MSGVHFLPLALVLLAAPVLSQTSSGGYLDDNDEFGSSVAAIGDVDGDGIDDLAVVARNDDDGGAQSGAVYILFLRDDGTVRTEQKLSQTRGGLPPSEVPLTSVGALGDLDGDGTPDIAVGSGRGLEAVVILFLNPDGTVRDAQRIANGEGGLGTPLDPFDGFGSSVAAVGDVDGDGVVDLAVGAPYDDDGGISQYTDRGAVYLLFLRTDGTVRRVQKYSDDSDVLPPLEDNDVFGWSVAAAGDVNGDGTPDLVVGAPRGSSFPKTRDGEAYVLLLSPRGRLRDAKRLHGGPWIPLNSFDEFGTSVAGLGDVDGDGTPDLAIGAIGDDENGSARGAIHVVFLNPSGTARASTKIFDPEGDEPRFSPDGYGTAVAGLGDFDGDGSPDLAAGLPRDEDGGFGRGAVILQRLSPEGAVLSETKISDTAGGFGLSLPEVTIEVLSSTREPRRGDHVFVRALATNHEPVPVRAQVYLEVEAPNGADRRFNVHTGRIPAGETVRIHEVKPIRFFLPDDAPAGTYTVRLVIGEGRSLGGATYDADTFTFDLPPSAEAPAPLSSLAPATALASPNPFRDRTVLRYTLAEAVRVRLSIHDALGREVAVLAEGPRQPGEHTQMFDARGLPSGVYVWRLRADGDLTTGRLTLAR